MAFTDMRHFRDMLPEDKKELVSADYDNLGVSIQNFNVGVTVAQREPYSRIELAAASGSLFNFNLKLHFTPVEAGKTEFSIDAEADLNFVMKAMLGPKIKTGLDKIVDGLVDVSEGRIPEGMPEGMKF